jgi:hypothetical protein
MNKSSQSKCFFAALRPLHCQSGKTWAVAFLRRYRSLLPLASVKNRYALPLHTRPSSFCLISAEAVLLTGKGKTFLAKFLHQASLRGTKQSLYMQVGKCKF